MGTEHTPNTSEFSAPHTSDAHPEVHVDQMHFDSSGKHDSTYDIDGITDPKAIEMGRETHEWHKSHKESSDEGSGSGK